MKVYETKERYYTSDGHSHEQTIYAFSTREAADRCAALHPGHRVVERDLDVFVDPHPGQFYWYVGFSDSKVTLHKTTPTSSGKEIAFTSEAWVWAYTDVEALAKASVMRAEVKKRHDPR